MLSLSCCVLSRPVVPPACLTCQPLLAEPRDEDEIVPSRVGGATEQGEDEATEAQRKQEAYLALAEELDTQVAMEGVDSAQPGDTGTCHLVSLGSCCRTSIGDILTEVERPMKNHVLV